MRKWSVGERNSLLLLLLGERTQQVKSPSVFPLHVGFQFGEPCVRCGPVPCSLAEFPSLRPCRAASWLGSQDVLCF